MISGIALGFVLLIIVFLQIISAVLLSNFAFISEETEHKLYGAAIAEGIIGAALLLITLQPFIIK